MPKYFLGLFFLLWWPIHASAVEIGDYPELGLFIDEMLNKHNFDEERLNALFEEAELRDDILAIMDRPGEAQPWYKYKTRFLTREHVVRGKRFWQKNSQAVSRASKQFRVPGEIIVAIIGIETNYGRTPGRHRVIDALTTLVVKYPRRQAFFRKELENYLLLTREQELDPLAIRGSYTGAIGIAQFMPSSYRAYAIDYDGNGSADLAGSAADAIGSVANYFHVHDWKPGEPIVNHPKLEGDLYPWLADLGKKLVFNVSELAKYGVRPSGTRIRSDEKTSLISFQEENAPTYRLVFHNFYVITRYNRSPKYALAVAELSAMIRKAYSGAK